MITARVRYKQARNEPCANKVAWRHTRFMTGFLRFSRKRRNVSYRQSFQNQKQGGGNSYKQGGGGYNKFKGGGGRQKSEFVPSINTGNLFNPQDKAIQENHVGRGTVVLDFDLLSENVERMKVRVNKDGDEATKEVVKLFINTFDNGKNIFVTLMPVNAVTNNQDDEEEQPRKFSSKKPAAARHQQPSRAPSGTSDSEQEEEEEEEGAPWEEPEEEEEAPAPKKRPASKPATKAKLAAKAPAKKATRK